MEHKIYIASGLKNYNRVIELRDKLKKYDIYLTYDWAQKYKEDLESGKTEAEEDWVKIAEMEYAAILDRKCSLFLLVTPAGRGSHFELGTAYTQGLPIVLLNESKDGIAFYTLPGIKEFEKEEDSIKEVLSILGK